MSDEWKQKYLNKVDQYDQEKKSWTSFEEFLKQTTSRLALAAQGNSTKLDELLPSLRKAIRKGEAQSKLSSIMEEISTELVRLDKIKANEPKGNSGFLQKLVNELSTNEAMDKKSKRLKKYLTAKNPPEDEELIAEFSKFFNHCLKISHEQGKLNKENKQAGFFSRIFDTLSSDKDNESVQAVSEQQAAEDENTAINPSDDEQTLIIPEQDKGQVPEKTLPKNLEEMEKSVTASVHNILESFIDTLDYPLAQRNALKDKLFAIKPTREIHILLDDLAQVLRDEKIQIPSVKFEQADVNPQAHEILIRLLESIPLSNQLKDQAEKLKDNFSRGISRDELPKALEAIASLIRQMQNDSLQEQKAFENFLLSMAGRLVEVDKFLESNLHEQKDAWQKGMELGNTVKEQVKGIGSSFSSATDIKKLEADVKVNIEKILSHVDRYKQNESQRVKRIQEQNNRLKEQIKKLESESSQLKNKIISSHQKAYTDPLTGLPNRLAYDQFLAEEYSRWQRYKENLLMMVWDIDFFKKVNDTYGHQAGDEVLKEVASLIRKNLREPDFVARFGGEEFVSLMPNTSLGGGYKVAEKIREAVQHLEFFYKEQQIELTISCGISLFADGDTPEKVFERADKGLYQAKEQGRNRCVVSQK